MSISEMTLISHCAWATGLVMVKEKTMAPQRTILSMPTALRERIKRYRFAKQINSEAEAIRVLLEKALDSEGVE